MYAGVTLQAPSIAVSGSTIAETASFVANKVTMEFVKACNAKNLAFERLAIVKSRTPIAIKHLTKDMIAEDSIHLLM